MSPAGPSWPIRERTWGILLGLWLLSLFGNATIIVPASVFPVIMENLAIGETGASWIVSVVLGVQMVTSIPVGFGIDRWNNRNVVGIATGLFALSSVLSWYAALTGTYLSLLFARGLFGIALISIWTVGITIIGFSFESSHQATAIGIFTASAPAGFALGQFSGPLLVMWFGWPVIFAIYGILALGPFVLFWISSSRQTTMDVATDAPSMGDLLYVLKNSTLWTIALMYFSAFSIYIFLNSWMPTYLNTVIGSSLTVSGLVVAVFPAMGMFSRSIGGILSDGVFGGRRRPIELLAFIVTLPAILVITGANSLVPVALALLVAGFTVQLSTGIFFTHARELVAPNLAASVIGFVTSIGLFGAFVTPILTGVFIERSGAFLVAFVYVGVLGIIGLLLAVLVPPSGAGPSREEVS